MNIKKCTNVSGRALHLCKKAHCSRALHLCKKAHYPETFVHFLMFIDTSKSFSLTFYCFYSVTHHFSTYQKLRTACSWHFASLCPLWDSFVPPFVAKCTQGTKRHSETIFGQDSFHWPRKFHIYRYFCNIQ